MGSLGKNDFPFTSPPRIWRNIELSMDKVGHGTIKIRRGRAFFKLDGRTALCRDSDESLRKRPKNNTLAALLRFTHKSLLKSEILVELA